MPLVKNNNNLLVIRLILLFLALLSPACSHKDEENIFVSASLSLKAPLLEVAELYLQANPTVNIIFNFGSSGILKQEIFTGIPADIFISSSTQPMDALLEHNMVLKSWPRILCSDELALIVRSSNYSITTFDDLLEPAVEQIAVGEGKFTSLGYYTYSLLDNLNWLEVLKPKLVYAKDSIQALTYLKREDVDAAIGYASTVVHEESVKIAVLAPQSAYPKIHFYIALLKKAEPLAECGDFALFLLSENSRKIFEYHGFELNGDAHNYQQFKR